MSKQRLRISILKLKIAAAASLIPLVLFTINQFILQTFNLAFPELTVRLKYAVQPTIYLLYTAAAVIIVLVINRQLKSLFNFLTDDSNYDNARSSSLKIPWILILVNSGLWLVAITLFYSLQGFKSEGGVPYFWSLTTNSISGCISATLAALIINKILIPAKIRLNMTDIREGENDLFAKIKIPLVFITGFIYTALILIYGARFYMVTSAEQMAQLPLGFELTMGITAAIALIPLMINMILFISEDRIQRSLLLQKMNILTSGSGDLGSKVTLINFDEIGALAAIINTFIEKIRTLILKAEKAGNQIIETSRDIDLLLSQLTIATTTMLEAINSVDSEINGQEEEIGRAKYVLDNFVCALSELTENIDAQSGSVEQTSQAVDMIAEALTNDESLIMNVEQQTGELINITSKGSGHISEFIESINAVEQSSQKVEDILEQMNSLSDQIDMLAMNAAIESAHAGEAGKGFAVVAEEVRRLSENNAEQSAQISEQMSEMMLSISEGNTKSKLADRSFRDISLSVGETAEQFQNIIGNIRNEESAIKDLLTTVKHLVSITESLKNISGTQQNQNSEIKNAIEKVFSRFGGLKQNMNSQRENRDLVSSSLSQLKSITNRNLLVVRELDEILNQFKL